MFLRKTVCESLRSGWWGACVAQKRCAYHCVGGGGDAGGGRRGVQDGSGNLAGIWANCSENTEFYNMYVYIYIDMYYGYMCKHIYKYIHTQFLFQRSI
jgi:hypothetical protein